MTQPIYRFAIRGRYNEAELASAPTNDWIEFLQVDTKFLYVGGKRFPLKLLDQLRSATRPKVASA